MKDSIGPIRRSVNDLHHSTNLLANKQFQLGYQSRFNALLNYFVPTNWSKVSLLDIGCGQGGFGIKFRDIGASTTFIDGRESNLSVVRKKAPNAHTILFNIELGKKVPVPQADLCLFMGLLYHVGNPAQAIRIISDTSDNICLETACLDHDGSAVVYFEEDTHPSSFSVSGKACRASPKWIEEALFKNGYTLIKDISKKEFNVSPGNGYSGLTYDWKIERTCGWRRKEHSLRRIWIASKSRETSMFKQFKT